MKRANVFFTLLFVIINVCRGSEPAQICHINPATRTDMCVAVQSVKSLHERGHDLLMTFSVRFHQGNGWAAFGVGNRMDRALMFVLWPGEQDGDIVLSLRSTTEHLPPNPLKNQKQIHVHGTEIDQNGLHVLRATCYSCNVIGLGELNITSENQPWLFAASYLQQTKTSDPNFRMSMHTDYGLRLVNMHRTLSMDQNEHHPTVSADRSLIHAIDPSGHHRSGHPTSTPASMNALNAHGLILSFSVVLNCLGIVLIRSGLKWAFRGHWIVQALSAIGLLTGCLMGILKSTSIFHVTTFASTHKLIGLVIAVGVPVQITLGYKHHINYVKYGHRTRASTFHIYLGRLLFVALNVNVFMGLLHGRKSNTLRLMWAVIVSVEILALAGMIFARRMNTHRAYKMVEGDEFDPFVIGDEEEK